MTLMRWMMNPSRKRMNPSRRAIVWPLLAEDAAGKVVPRTVLLVTNVPHIQKLLDVHNGTYHGMQFLDPVRKGMSIFPVHVTAHACMQLFF